MKLPSPRIVPPALPILVATLVLVMRGAAPVGAQPAQDVDGAIYLPIAVQDALLAASVALPVTPAPAATDTPAPVPTSTSAATPTEPTATTTPDPDPDPDPSEPSLAGCGAARFLDVSAYQQDPAYPDPELEATCEEDELVVRSNGIPNFEFVRITPNDLAAQDYTWRMPIEPTPLEEPADIPLLGPVAIAVNGLPIYGPNEAPNMGTADPVLDQILDFCQGHTARRGDYHFHARPDCLFEDTEGAVSLVLGYAFDGYPIVAPWACVEGDCTRTVKLESSWQRTQDLRNAWDAHEYVEGSGDLDRCNGMVGPAGDYRYVATDTFPYLLGCYAGEAPTNGGGGGPGGGGPPGPRPFAAWLAQLLPFMDVAPHSTW